MEPKGRGKRPADQLQGPAVQDQAVRSEPKVGMSSDRNGDQPVELDMLVIQFGDRTVKGYANTSKWPSAEAMDLHLARPVFRKIGSDEDEPIPLEGIKAIFFVKSFEGKWHDDLRFH